MALCPTAKAQKFIPAPVEISKTTVEVDGRTYYIHTVEAKQTLYSICKTYRADIEEVKEINAGKLTGGLKTGSLLMIPMPKPEAIPETTQQEPSVDSGIETEESDDNYIRHKVTWYDSMLSLSVRYNVSIEEIMKLNNLTSSTLGVGDIIKIPVREKPVPAPSTVKTPVDENPASADVGEGDDDGDGKYIYHRVKWYDSLMMIALKYNVSQEDIIRLNNLTSSTVNVGQMLKIPVGKGITITEIDDNAILDTPDDFGEDSGDGISLTIIDNGDEADADWQPQFVPFGGTANMTLMLPFAAKSNAPADIFMDFYAGVLLAMEDLRQDGTNINLKVVDMSDFDTPGQMMEESGLADQDFIIGNFPLEGIDEAAHWCDVHHIPLVSPLDQKIEYATYAHRYLVNAQLSTATQTMRLAESIDYTPGKDNVVVICDNGEQPVPFHTEVIQSLDSLGIPYTISHGSPGRSLGEIIKSTLKAGMTNHIIITSEKETLVADAVRNIGLIARNGNYDIIGYASHKVRRFDSIDSELFKRMNAHFLMGYNVDYSDERVRNFVRKYRALYNTEPGNFAFQGYDVTVYFVSALKKYGNNMINGIADYPAEGLQLNFRFDRRNAGGGMFNEATKNVVY